MKRLLLSALLWAVLLCNGTIAATTQTHDEVQRLRQEMVGDLRDNVLPFWTRFSPDPRGGFYGALKRDGTPIADAPKGGVLNARILWTMSTAYRMYGDTLYRQLADRAQRYFIDHFIDPQYGGVYWTLKADGTPLDTDKQIYGSAYAIYGLAEHYRATRCRESLQRAIELYCTLEQRVRDPQEDGYRESFSRQWGKPERMGYDGDGRATKSMNTHIHVLEAYTALYRVWQDKELCKRLAKVMDMITERLYDDRTHHLTVYCDDHWNALGRIDSYGHDIETSWLLTEAAEVLGDPQRTQRCRQVAIELVDVTLREGLHPLGHTLYERQGERTRRDASWWCQAETVVGCINAWQLTGHREYLHQAQRTWHFIKTYMIDREQGEWFRTVTEEGEPRLNEPKASLWNCPYHNSRMAFEADCRLAPRPDNGTEVMAWSNLTGIRVRGERMELETTLRVGDPARNDMETSGKEKQPNPRYHREENRQMTTTTLRGVNFRQTVTDVAEGRVHIDLEAACDTTLTGQAAYICITLPHTRYADAHIRRSGRQVSVHSTERQLTLKTDRSVQTIINTGEEGRDICFRLLPALKRGATASLTLELQCEGTIDNGEATLTLDTTRPGRRFAGLGGNFRLQNPRHDPLVMDYCLDRLRIAYGRVELPWRGWQPQEEELTQPWDDNRPLDAHVEKNLLTARRLKAKGMPLVLSCWFPPEWAIDGNPQSYVRQGGVIAYRLNPRKQEQIYRSIAGYLLLAKQRYGVEFDLFSFNESDLGIDVLHTPRQHADFIKGFGAYLARLDLPTKMLLGDNSDATTFDFIRPAMEDAEARPYIGAVSFHSWRGCDDATLHRWADAARQLNVPLLIGEGSTDAAAHRYPEIFNEPTFALYEINLYTRICAICQPLSILQWQLTSDYSLLKGAGIFGTEGPLRPTQRFWNLKQLASTPPDALALPVECDKPDINCAAFGNLTRDEYAIHMVNNGAARQAMLHGLPADIRWVKVCTTNSRQHAEPTVVPVEAGTVRITLPSVSFVTVTSCK